MRTRQVRPGFFTNELLAECSPLARLLFVGLFLLSDREGRMEDRPARIKATVLPYDACKIDTLLTELQVKGFIIRYAVEGKACICIPKFKEHQKFHPHEPWSVLPEPPNGIACSDMSRHAIPHTPSDRVISLREIPKQEDSARASVNVSFERFWTAYPRKTAKKTALASWKKLDPSPDLQQTILDALDRQKKSEQWLRGVIPHPATWLNQSRWEDVVQPGLFNGAKPPALTKTTDDIIREAADRRARSEAEARAALESRKNAPRLSDGAAKPPPPGS